MLFEIGWLGEERIGLSGKRNGNRQSEEVPAGSHKSFHSYRSASIGSVRDAFIAG
jgi:hypothetical protein